MRVLKSIGRLAIPIVGSLLLGACGLRLPVDRNPVKIPPTSVSADRKTPLLTHDSSPEVSVYLLADTLHTGMVFPYEWLIDSGFIPPENFGRPLAVSMSWGNRDAYVQKRWLSPWKVCRALFSPSPSVMEMVPVNWNVAEVIPHQRIYQKFIARDRGPQVAAFLNNCSRMDANGRPNVIGPSSWGDGVLLESRHAYFFPRICNVWTIQAIEATGADLNAWFGLSANGVIRQAQNPPNGFQKIWGGPEE